MIVEWDRARKRAVSCTLFANNIRKRNMLIAEKFISRMVEIYGTRPISTDNSTWYPMAFKFLKLKKPLHPSFFAKKEKCLIEG